MNKFAFGSCVVAVMGTAAFARPLYEKTLLLNGDNGGFAWSGQLIADDFTLSADASLGHATWYGNYLFEGDPYDTGAQVQFTLRFYNDAGGSPTTSPFAMTVVTATATDTGIDHEIGDRIYLFAADFGAVNVSASTKYYFSVEESDPNTAKPAFRWNNGENTDDDNLSQFSFDGGATWNSDGGARHATAFSLDTVPAPGAAALGMIAMGMGLHRRR